MRLTARGWVLALAVALAMASAAVFGPRGLNAIAAPGLVALIAGAWQVYRTEPPAVERNLPERGERGGTVRVRLDVEVTPPRSVRVIDDVGPGLRAEGALVDLVLGESTIAYDLHLGSRGRREVGPATVVVRDVLGVVESRHGFLDRDAILVHPRVHLLAGPRSDALARLHGGAGDEHRAFDGLRRYRRGDPLRDIHWRSSARQPDGQFVVKQFAVEEGARTVEIAAGASAGEADAMAEVVASVAVALLESGVRVGVTTTSGRIEPDGVVDRRQILDFLAEVGYGPVGRRARREADVVVDAAPGRVRIDLGPREVTFAELAGTSIGASGSPSREVPA